MNLTIDSSVFVSALHKDEKYSDLCLKLLKKVDHGEHRVIISMTVLIEIVAAIKRRTGSAVLAKKAQNFILQIKNLSFVDLNYDRTLEIIDFVIESKLRGMDAIVAATAKEFECSLVTLDQEIIDSVKDKIKIKLIKDL